MVKIWHKRLWEIINGNEDKEWKFISYAMNEADQTIIKLQNRQTKTIFMAQFNGMEFENSDWAIFNKIIESEVNPIQTMEIKDIEMLSIEELKDLAVKVLQNPNNSLMKKTRHILSLAYQLCKEKWILAENIKEVLWEWE